LKRNNAIIDVATISKLLSNDAFDAFAFCKPIIKNMGAIISSKIIAIVYGNSFFVNFDFFIFFLILWSSQIFQHLHQNTRKMPLRLDEYH